MKLFLTEQNTNLAHFSCILPKNNKSHPYEIYCNFVIEFEKQLHEQIINERSNNDENINSLK